MLKILPIAIGPANIKRPSSAATVSTPQVALTGVIVLLFTLLHHRLPGIAPSREYAKTTRVAVIVQPWPTKNWAIMLMENNARPAF